MEPVPEIPAIQQVKKAIRKYTKRAKQTIQPVQGANNVPSDVPVIKRVRKPRTKQIIQPVEGTEQIANNQDYTGPVILGIDPAFKKCGFAIITKEGGKYVHSFQSELRPFEQKLNQSQVDGYIANNVQKIITNLFNKYKIANVVIELQLGQFSADRVQLSIVQALPQDVPYVVQHSKLKLKHKQTKEIPADNPDSNKYNQNKHQGRQLAQILFPDMPKLTFDEYDSILHAKYVYDNMDKINWITKSQLTQVDKSAINESKKQVKL